MDRFRYMGLPACKGSYSDLPLNNRGNGPKGTTVWGMSASWYFPLLPLLMIQKMILFEHLNLQGYGMNYFYNLPLPRSNLTFKSGSIGSTVASSSGIVTIIWIDNLVASWFMCWMSWNLAMVIILLLKATFNLRFRLTGEKQVWSRQSAFCWKVLSRISITSGLFLFLTGGLASHSILLFSVYIDQFGILI